jgi:putative transposase
MLKAFKTQIYPTSQQASYLERSFGCGRFVFNWALEKEIESYKISQRYIGKYELMKMLSLLKKTAGKEWLKEVDSTSLQAKIEDVDSAYQKFFRKEGGYPHFKSKHRDTPSFTVKMNCVIASRHSIKIPKIEALKTREKLNKGIKPRRITLSRRAGRYFASILYESGASAWGIAGEEVGIDVGIKDFAALSTGEKIANPKTYRAWEKKLAHEQRMLSKKQKGNRRRERQHERVARLHYKVARIREDFLHKVSTAITWQLAASRYGYVALENLNVAGMMKNRRLAKSIADASWGRFGQMLEYKGKWYGAEVRRIGRFEPSSQICHVCGYRNKGLTLEVREWTCPECGAVLDRDVNAAINIVRISKVPAGSGKHGNMGRVEEPALAGPGKRENLEGVGGKGPRKGGIVSAA